MKVCFHGSLERARKQIHRSNPAAEIVEKVNFFFKFYVLHEGKYQRLHQSDADLLQCAEYKDCPQQDNGYDGGNFTVAVVLHLLEQREVNEKAFTQGHVTEARKQLATALINVNPLLLCTLVKFSETASLCSKLLRETAVPPSLISLIVWMIWRGKSVVPHRLVLSTPSRGPMATMTTTWHSC